MKDRLDNDILVGDEIHYWISCDPVPKSGKVINLMPGAFGDSDSFVATKEHGLIRQGHMTLKTKIISPETIKGDLVILKNATDEVRIGIVDYVHNDKGIQILHSYECVDASRVVKIQDCKKSLIKGIKIING